MKIAVVGVTGMVGREMLKVLEERNFPVDEFIPVASEKSAGQKISLQGNEYTVITIDEAIKRKPAIALFSAGSTASLEYSPRFAEVGTTVIDNSSAWRMHAEKKLIVPEINGQVLIAADKIIANPNCSTIQLVMVLDPLHKKYKINRVVVSTYQSVSGTGKAAVNQLMNERNNIDGEKIYPYQIDLNCIPQVDVFLENGSTKEEMKMVNETKKIMMDDTISVTATCVRVPVIAGHSEAVNISFENEIDLNEVRKILSNTPGITVQDDPTNKIYPMPILAHGKDDVFVGRIRRDDTFLNSLNCWIVSDNLRKGAATNAVQIAEYLLKNNLV